MKRLLVLATIITGMIPGLSLAKEAGYLAPDAVDILAILPPAPAAGDPRFEADRAIFKTTRRFAGSPRWALATTDVSRATPDLLRDFSCAAGLVLTEDAAPSLVHLLKTADADTGHAAGFAKDHFKRLRPFLIDPGETCEPTESLAKGYDYPSNHATQGWTWGTLLAELIPERASALLARGRAYGDSRIVCGAHNASAVEAARLTAASVIAVLHTSAAFQADLKTAHAELDGLRGDARTRHPTGCDGEAELVGVPVFQ